MGDSREYGVGSREPQPQNHRTPELQRTESRKRVGAGLVSARVEQKTEARGQRTHRAETLEIGYSLLDIGHSPFVFLNIQ